jgi:hypothetical protein
MQCERENDSDLPSCNNSLQTRKFEFSSCHTINVSASMGMLEDILGQVLKTAVDRVGKEVTGQASPKSPPPVQTPAPTGDPLTQILASVLGADKKNANPILVIILQFIEANGAA